MRMTWLLVVVAACQSHENAAPRTETGSATPPTSADARAPKDGDEPIEEPRADARVKVDEPEPAPDPGKQLYELGAVPAWQAVVDRNLYLERRNQHGVVYGTLGAAITVRAPAPAGAGSGFGSGRGSAASAPGPADAGTASPPGDAGMVETPTPYSWLVDDTEGNGSLAIRVALPATTTAKPGDRIALAGAWALDADRRWFWKPTLVTSLAPAPPSKAKDPPAAPGHTIVNGDLPAGVRPISLAKEGEAAYFTVVGGQPVAEGDGWLVADELGNPPYALLSMPGEHASFGAQDLRTADEKWTLKRAQTYWVRIGPVHRHGPDKPVTINAHTAPIRVK
jgi:hypothetical protein